MIRKDVIIAVIATFCLTASLFMVTTSRSQTEPEYNPWADYNGDGTIDIFDIVHVAGLFGSNYHYEWFRGSADARPDGLIDIFDISIVANTFGAVYFEYP